MKIADFEIGRSKTFIIAEIGGNHEGSFEKAEEMVRLAAQAGADAVKFQILQAGRIVHARSSKPAYSGITHQKQWERFKKIEFTKDQYRHLKKTAEANGALFFASVFDAEVLETMDDLLPAYKVASGDLTYYSLLRLIRKKKKPVLLSTGASTMQEIQEAVQWLGKKDLALLHCVCAYPAPYEDMNLKVIPALQKKFKLPVGFSDHSFGIECVLGAVALGACIIEKHFTTDKSIPVGDHRLSVNPHELQLMVDSIRHLEQALGKKQRPVFPAEMRARDLVRRSLYAIEDIKAGQKVTAKNIRALRPLEGMGAEKEPWLIGKPLRHDVSAGAPLFEKDIKLNRKKR